MSRLLRQYLTFSGNLSALRLSVPASCSGSRSRCALVMDNLLGIGSICSDSSVDWRGAYSAWNAGAGSAGIIGGQK